MKKEVIVLILLVLLIIISPLKSTGAIESSQVEIDPLVIERLKNQSEVYVTVMLKDDSNISYAGTRNTIAARRSIYEQKKAYFRQVEGNVLSTLSSSEFKVDYKFSIMNAFSRYITKQRLEKLNH